jgi:hypothetical protein
VMCEVPAELAHAIGCGSLGTADQPLIRQPFEFSSQSNTSENAVEMILRQV